MTAAKTGDSVKIHYTGTLDDGTVFDSSKGREPLEFTLGEGRVIPGFEAGVLGMETGATKTIHIPAAEAYGLYQDDMKLQVGRDEFPKDMPPQIGQQLQMQNPSGQAFTVVVAAVTDTAVVLDANHPLAGKDLNFDLELVEIS